MTFDGTISAEGAHVASGVLQKLLPLIEIQYDEFRGAHRGTINVQLKQPIDFRIDFSTHDNFNDGNDNFRFEFVRVHFELPPGPKTKAWIFQPYGHHWGKLQRKSMVEILVSEFIEDIAPGKHCLIHILNEHWGSSSTSPHYVREMQKR
jgi:hypothetical protein